MADSLAEPELKSELIRDLRDRAEQGARVRDLVGCVQSGLALKETAVLPVLWYFTKAFHLTLRDVLPIREWLGTDSDQEIDALILPAIRRTHAQWAADRPNMNTD